MEEYPNVKNIFGEKIDVVIEGKSDATTTIIFVHGFGANKNEGGNYFAEIADALKDRYRVVRFDFTGYGNSEGNSEDVDYKKQTEDLKTIINYIDKRFGGKLFIFAHSMGCFVTAMLCPDNIEKAVLSNIPNHNTKYLSEFFQSWITSKPGGQVDKNGTSIFPRSAGGVQKIGASFWKVLEKFEPFLAVSDFAKKTNLLITHAKQDPIIGTKFVDEYAKIPNVRDIWLDGDHNYTKKEDRAIVIEKVIDFFKENL